MKNRKNHPSLHEEELSAVMEPKVKPWARHRFFDATQRKFEARLGPAGGFQVGSLIRNSILIVNKVLLNYQPRELAKEIKSKNFEEALFEK